MTRAQERRFRKLLRQKQAELLERIKARPELLQVEYVGDPADRVQQLAERELAARNVDHVSAMLKRIDGALTEIGEGTFGVCNACGRPIPLKRLELVPWSPYCVRCQELAECTGQQEKLAGLQELRAPAGEAAADLRRRMVA